MKKIISLLLVAFVVFIPITQKTVFAQSSNENTCLEKIIFHDTENDLNIKSDSQLKKTTSEFNKRLTEDSYIMLQFNSNYQKSEEYKELLKKRDAIVTDQDKKAFRESVKTVSKTYHKKIFSEKLQKLALPANTKAEHIDYTPFVKISANNEVMDSAVISRLALSNEIKNLDIALTAPTPIIDESYPDCKNTPIIDNSASPNDDMGFGTALDVIGAKSIVNNSTYTGNGVKIGLYESGGIPSVNHINLQGKNIIIRDPTRPQTDHATSVASIIFAIAPNVTLYASDVNTFGVAWFIDNGVDVVNCSFGYYNNTLNSSGTYTNGEKRYRNDIDGVYDYQIQTNFIQVVKSAGNYNNNNTSARYNPDNRISSPGHAKNVITVGGIKRSFKFSCSVFGYVNEHEPNASYTTVEMVSKPNISAPYSVNIPNVGTRHGTSFAAPQVTGVLALFLENNYYSTWPEKIHALIDTTASEIYGQMRDYANFDNRVGAGIINLNNMLNVKGIMADFIGNSLSSQREVYSKTIYLNKNNMLKSTLFWLVRFESDTLYCTDYDLHLYDSNNNRVVQSSTASNNAEMIIYKAPSSGSYRLVVYQFGSFQGTSGVDWFALAYNY